jgi:hypothetical protein
MTTDPDQIGEMAARLVALQLVVEQLLALRLAQDVPGSVDVKAEVRAAELQADRLLTPLLEHIEKIGGLNVETASVSRHLMTIYHNARRTVGAMRDLPSSQPDEDD